MAVESINTHIRTKKTCYENISNSTVSPAAKLQLMQFSNYYAQIPIEGWVFFLCSSRPTVFWTRSRACQFLTCPPLKILLSYIRLAYMLATEKTGWSGKNVQKSHILYNINMNFSKNSQTIISVWAIYLSIHDKANTWFSFQFKRIYPKHFKAPWQLPGSKKSDEVCGFCKDTNCSWSLLSTFLWAS